MFRALIPGAFGLAIIAMVFWIASDSDPAAAQNQSPATASMAAMGGAGGCMSMIPSMPGNGATASMSGTADAMNMSVRPSAGTLLQQGGISQDGAKVPPASPIEQEIRYLSAKIDSLTRKIDEIAAANTVGAAAPLEFTKGVVTEIDVAQRELTINHEELKSLSMPAMTMAFLVTDEAMLARIKVGQTVEFVAKRDNGRIVITEIK